MKKIVVIGLSGESIFLKVDHFNSIGETIIASEKFSEPGGKGFNQAAALGKLKANVSFITVLGNDQYASVCEKTLLEHHVKPYIIKKNVPTDYAVIITDKAGENQVTVYNKASKLVTVSDIMRYHDVIDEADILLIQFEYPYEVMKEIIDYAYKKGVDIILNPAPAHTIDEATLRKISVIIPNEFEIYNLLEKTKELEHKETNLFKIMKDIELLGVETQVCTRGSKTVVTYNDSIRKEYQVSDVVVKDTTGAGDVFCSGITFAIAMDMNLAAAVEFAVVAASLSITKAGVLTSLPTRKEIFSFMENNSGK